MPKMRLNKETLKRVLQNIKPQKSIWGFLGVILFFIAPEIVAFIYGGDITNFCEAKLKCDLPYAEQYLYENIEMFFGEGSWLNLTLGFVFLIWLFF